MDGKKLSSVSDAYLSDDASGLSDRIPLASFLRENILILSFGFLGLIFLTIGIFSLNSQNKETEIIFEEGAQTEEGQIKVDIEGAVVKTGVYEVSSSARVQDVLILAGGLSSGADREWAAKNLNLAAKLNDGTKIYIPQEGEVDNKNPKVTVGGGQGLEGGININSASAEELDKLPGVGPVTAQKIIDGRPYQDVEDLVNKKIVGASTFSKIKDQLTLW